MSVADRVDELLSHLDAPGMPGAAVAVLVDSEVVYQRCYGHADIGADVPFTPDTPFAIASMTKQFTTTCILLLEEEGMLSLQEDYRTYLPEMPDFGGPVTIEHLCTNTSGIRDIFALVALSGGHRLAPRTRSLVADVIGRQRSLNFPTGSQYRYSNPNFQLLSWIVERVTGQRLGEFMAERIFEPLGMADTLLQDLRGPAFAGGARAYDGAARDELRPSEWEEFARSGSGEGGGAIWSTLDDLILWERNFDHNVIGSEHLLDRLTRAPGIPGGDRNCYARGLFVGAHRGLIWHGHGGGLGPFTSNRVRFPDAGVSVIMLSNSSLANPFLDVFGVADAVLDRRPQGGAAPVWEKVPTERLRPWLGAYEDGATGFTFELRDDNGAACLVWFGSPVPLETAGSEGLVALRGASLPTLVTPGAAGPEPEIAVQLGPNPPLRLKRSPAPSAGGLELFEGRYFSGELEAAYTVSLDRGGLSLAIESPLGSKDGLPMFRVTDSGFTTVLGPDQRPLLFFPHDPGAPPTGAVATLARAEGLRLRRID